MEEGIKNAGFPGILSGLSVIIWQYERVSDAVTLRWIDLGSRSAASPHLQDPDRRSALDTPGWPPPASPSLWVSDCHECISPLKLWLLFHEQRPSNTTRQHLLISVAEGGAAGVSVVSAWSVSGTWSKAGAWWEVPNLPWSLSRAAGSELLGSVL